MKAEGSSHALLSISSHSEKMMLKVTPLVRHMPWLIVLAACLAAIINLHPYELYLGISLIFGMSIALMTLFFAGGWWGVVVAIPASLATVYLWGQPYSCIIFLFEALVLTLCRNSRHGELLLQKGQIIVVDFLFWLFLGAPLYYLTHLHFIGLGHEDAIAIAKKALLNGVVNILLAVIVYSGIALVRNRRIQGKATISIQSISLSTIYSLVVFIALFATSHLYNSVISMQAKNLNSQFLSQAYYIMDVLDPDSSDAERSEIIDYMKRMDSFFHWHLKKSPLDSLSTPNSAIDVIADTYNDSTGLTPISVRAAQLAQSPDFTKLLMPKKSAEGILLKRYQMGHWLAHVTRNGEVVTIMRTAQPEFSELTDFYKSMLSAVIYSLSIGIVLSAVAAFALEREFSSVLRAKRKAAAEKSQGEDIFLRLSPIQEIQDLALKVNERTAIIQNDRKKIQELNGIAQQQLSTAGEIQQCFLGSRHTPTERPDVSLFMRPAYNAGGDWYDAFDLDGKTFLVVADVCDKGVGAALFMSVFRTLIRYSAESLCLQDHYDTEPLDKVITSVNNYMSTEHGDTSMFATVFLACINNKTKRLDYVLAGHEEPILLRSNGESYKFEVSGPAIGLFPFANYSIGSTSFDPGSILIGYSDGVVDARNASNVSFGHQRLLDLILMFKDANLDLQAQTITDQLVAELDRHIGDADQFDDITIAAAIL
jgi:serine phosphatase RsbU (regulator of sigma subunit)